jgi:membrane-bound inhibitor of C-type lysozyme
MITISRLVLVFSAISLACINLVSAAVADDRVRFRCEDGRKFTITFLTANDNQLARLVFAGSRQTITLKNQVMASGIFYAGDGWEYHEWQGKSTLVDMSSAKPKEIACSRN